MTTPDASPPGSANASPATTPTPGEQDAITLSSFLADALKAKKDSRHGYPQDHKCNHDQRPGRPPHGTRRAMGRR